MDIRHLTCFIETAKHLNFTKASKILHVAQPAISKTIKSLEEELGVMLFSRNKKQLCLTSAGINLLSQANHLLTTFNQISSLKESSSFQDCTITVGLPPIIGSCYFSPIINEFLFENPSVTIKLIEEGSKQIAAYIQDGTLDIGVIVLPLQSASICITPLVSNPLFLVISTDHALAQNNCIDFSFLKNESFILFHENFSLHQLTVNYCHQFGFQPKIICASTQWDLIIEMVSANLGIALLPEALCKRINDDRIKIIPFSDSSISFQLAIIFKQDTLLSSAARQLLALVQEIKPNYNYSPAL